ncbi:MAG: hypothetical protein L6V83_02450 [Christensenella sp.]|nr:MAG: hypothetical protein L6V83_02450 [Christensenella sp.]
MPTNPFVILGVDKNATQSEILEAYKQKRAYYQAHVFDEGESGAQAASMLNQLDDAYQQAMEMAVESATVTGEGESAYEQVKQAIRSKDIETAQKLLDDMSYRGAEWHYYQSVVFYEKNWLNDTKKQLEIALQMDPQNEKYQRALDNLKKKIDGSRPYDKEGAQGVYNADSAQTDRTYTQRDGAVADGICSACQALWCADCCCECMGGDLIRCC